MPQGPSGGLRLSLSDPALSRIGASSLSLPQFRHLVEYADLRMASMYPAAPPDVDGVRFLAVLAQCVAEYRKAYREGRIPDAGLLREIRSAISDNHRALRARAGVSYEAYGQALSYRYHVGFNHLLKDDDFIAVRRGGRAVEIIPLAGNDRNEIKRFLREAGDRCLSASNVDDLRAVVREVRKSRAASLVRSLGPYGGLRLKPGED